MSFPHSIVLIIPAAQKQEALDFGAALGFSFGFSAALSATGSAPATAYGLHTWSEPGFKAILSATGAQVRTWIANRAGATEAALWTNARLLALRNGLTLSVDRSDLTPRQHFDAVLTDNSLTPIAALQ